MRPRTYRLLLAGLVALAAVAVWIAKTSDPSDLPKRLSNPRAASDLPLLSRGPQPSLDKGNGFLNGKPKVEGKVVLYDFWTYSCVNCVRTLPYVQAWHERYAADGLVVVGVHSPEFDFEKIHGNVKAAVKKLRVTYPVVFDDDMAIWRAFHNQYWPAKYIADRKGDLRFLHFGEGNYDDTETVIRLLLGVAKDAPRAANPDAPESSFRGGITPETYLGRARGDQRNYMIKGWAVAEQYIESNGVESVLTLRYHAGEVNLVFDRASAEPVAVKVELDGKPVPVAARGASIVVRRGATFVDVDAADLYRLIVNGPPGDHTLTLRPRAAGVQAFAFTFGE